MRNLQRGFTRFSSYTFRTKPKRSATSETTFSFTRLLKVFFVWNDLRNGFLALAEFLWPQGRDYSKIFGGYDFSVCQLNSCQVVFNENFILIGKPKSSLFVSGTLLGGIGGFGVTAGAHRYWTHKSFKATLPLKLILLLSFSTTGQVNIHYQLDFRPTKDYHYVFKTNVKAKIN